jgi:protein-L-isoaspartate(D-aspartate) O-methyltransferase
MQPEKERLISELIDYGYLKTPAVISAFKKVPRENFVEKEYVKQAYVNEPLPIREGQTISQPLTVAAMTEALQPRKGHKVLEIGAGSGYQAAILAEVVKPGKIITLERKPRLVEFSKNNIKKCGYQNISVIHSDGANGWPDKAPYDRIIVTASAREIPQPLVDQLKAGGRLVIPVGDELILIEKNKELKKTFLGYYVFVPLLGGKD